MTAPSTDPTAPPTDSTLTAVASSTTPGSTSSSMPNRAGVREKSLHDEIELVEDGMNRRDLKREREEWSGLLSGIAEGSAEGDGAPLTARDKRALASFAKKGRTDGTFRLVHTASPSSLASSSFACFPFSLAPPPPLLLTSFPVLPNLLNNRCRGQVRGRGPRGDLLFLRRKLVLPLLPGYSIHLDMLSPRMLPRNPPQGRYQPLNSPFAAPTSPALDYSRTPLFPSPPLPPSDYTYAATPAPPPPAGFTYPPTSTKTSAASPSRSKRRRWVHWRHCLMVVVLLLLALGIYLAVGLGLGGSVEEVMLCSTCMGVMRPLKALAMMGDAAFVGLFVSFCIELKIQDKDVCQGAVGSQAPIMAHVLRKVDLDSPSLQTFCSTVFGLCPLQDVKPRVLELSAPPTSDLTRRESASGPEGGEGGLGRKRWESKGGKPFQVVHISDSHVDWKYAVGAEAQCSKIICCRRYPELEGAWPYKNASKFGEPKCDTPPALLQSMLNAVDRIAPNRSFNIYTGDAVDDAVWDLQVDVVAQDLTKWHTSLAGNMTNSTSAKPPSYPAFGNHDVVPVNAFPRNSTLAYNTDGSPQWAYDLAANDWEKWIGPEGAEQVRTNSGCYSRVHPGTKLRLISLNTNYWYKQNFWAYDSNSMSWDPNGIIMWLAGELDAAEKAGQRAWIIGHISPGKADILRDQSNYLDQVFQRYHETIAAHFYGHTHADEFSIVYSDYSQRSAATANGVAFVAGSLTPTGGNPVFRVYDVDPDTYEIVDLVPFYANLTAPSFQNDPEWERYYSARESYGSLLDPPHPSEASLNATFWHRITEAFEKNHTAFQLFNTRLSRGGAVWPCDDEACISNRICMARAMRSQDNCQVVKPHFSFRKRDLLSFDSSPSPRPRFSPYLSPVHHPHQHDHFACEGPGLPSMLRALSSGELDFKVQEAARAKGRMRKREQTKELAALRLFQEEAHRAVKRHRAEKRWWRRWGA